MKMSEFAKLLSKEAYNFKECEIDGFSIDSRKIGKNQVFIAIKTEKNDGHNYLEDALKKGACGFLVSYKRRSLDLDAFPNLFFVADTVSALQKAAKKHAENKIKKSVAITGSAGKTTTKELIFHIFKSYYKTKCTPGNFNNTLGLPLSILNEVKDNIDYFVAEFGMSYKGEIAKLVEILNPDIRVWLNVFSAHLGNFNSIEEIREAKAEILLKQSPNNLVVYNIDDIFVKSSVERSVGIKYSFGKSEKADLRIVRCLTFLDYSEITFAYENAEFTVKTNLTGEHNCYNVAAAILTALLADIPLRNVIESCENFIPVKNRGFFEIKGDIFLFNDTYNSNPEALKRVITHFSSVPHNGRKVIIVGDMLELGKFSERKHREIGKLLNESNFDLIITWGKESEFINMELKNKENYHFGKNTDVVDKLENLIKSGDLVVVKASRGMRGEVIVDAIKEKWGEK